MFGFYCVTIIRKEFARLYSLLSHNDNKKKKKMICKYKEEGGIILEVRF